MLAQFADLARRFPSELQAQVRSFTIGRTPATQRVSHSFGPRPQVMGVINLSRQSWYRESISTSEVTAIRRGRVLWAQGAAVIDLGGESTQSYADAVSEAEQVELLAPVISALSAESVNVSVETYSPAVAQAGLEAGACVINMTGAEHEKEIFTLAARYGAAVIICFSQQANVRVPSVLHPGEDPIPLLLDHFRPRVAAAEAAGVSRIFVDPGLGFHYVNLTDGPERVRYQAQVLLNGFRLRALGWPICQALPRAFDQFEENFRSAEPFFAVLAALGRTGLLRTHEVPQVNAVLGTLDLVGGSGRYHE